MERIAGSLLFLLAAGCASSSPAEHATAVRAMPGKKPLRVGLVVLGNAHQLPEAFPDPAPAPGGAAPVAPPGTLYSERVVLPESLPADDVLGTVVDLAAFTDVVPLPFDSRGVVSHAGMVQRLQDRLWPNAIAQELDALLVIEGVRDGGLRWSDADESLFSLDTVLWWLVWPFGALIPDREYGADATLVAELFALGDQRATPVPVDASARATPTRLHPWERAATPPLSLVLPPVWVGDDATAVSEAVRRWSRAMLPIELVRQLKAQSFAHPGRAQIDLRLRDGGVELTIDCQQEVTEAVLTTLPRGALTEPCQAVPVPLQTRLESGPQGTRYLCTGRVARDTIDQGGHPLVRARLTLLSGDVVSQTWAWSELPR